MPPPTSARDVKFADVLGKADLLGEAPEISFLCVVPERCGEMDLAMTDTVRARFPRLEELLLAELAQYGVILEESWNA